MVKFFAISALLASVAFAQDTITATSINQAQASAIISGLSSYNDAWTRTADPSLVSIGEEGFSSLTALYGAETNSAVVASSLVDIFPSLAEQINSVATVDFSAPSVTAILGDNAPIVQESEEILDNFVQIINQATEQNEAVGSRHVVASAAALVGLGVAVALL